ncbi:hypothetical protein IWW55_003751 [Coemansia sp. RSA 2706]|nr:hypothetical protein IWW55_003751 [Coemansia sp. RSA 2706]KAJ2726090.1 hypothetical protein H4R23_004073 [Coemansia sp. Cherry 401B]
MASANDLIGSIHALKRRPAPDAALLLLQRVAAQVRPVMHKRGWRVGVLREFFPRTPNLLGLNVNRGAEIRIRLRSPHNDGELLAYPDLVGTMLHELAHIERGPHDAAFYAVLDTLKAETELLMAQGYAGDGFFSRGQRVGQGCSHNAPRHALREQTLRAVAKRQRALGGPPRALGTRHALQAQLTPPQMAARALERRLRDERWCGAADLIVISDSEPDSDGVVVVIDD